MNAVIPFTLYADDTLARIDQVIEQQARRWFKQRFASDALCCDQLQQAWQCGDDIRLRMSESDNDKATVIVQRQHIKLRATCSEDDCLSLLGLTGESLAQNELLCVLRALLSGCLNSLLDNGQVNTGQRDKVPGNGSVQQNDTPQNDDVMLNPWVKGTGVVYKRCSFEGLAIEILCSGHLFLADNKQIAQPEPRQVVRNPLHNRADAIGRSSLRLIATLGSAEISIGELNKISVGDVIAFDKPFNGEIDIVNRQGEKVCSGKLGAKDNHRAIRISAP